MRNANTNSEETANIPVPEDRTLQALCFFLESTAPVGRYIDVEDTDNDEGHLLIQLGHIGF